MIAHDLGHRYIDEEEFGIEYQHRLEQFLATQERLVIQCPGMCYCIEQFSAEGVAILMMVRPVEAIMASERRIGWSDVTERAKYEAAGIKAPISVLKYVHWENYQRGRIEHAFMINYGGLCSHPLWIAKPLRADFVWNQTTLEEKEESCTSAS